MPSDEEVEQFLKGKQRKGRDDPGFVPREFENFTFVERNGVAVAGRSNLDLREGVGVRVSTKDDRDADRVSVRFAKKAIGFRYYAHSGTAQQVPTTTWTLLDYDQEIYDFGGTTNDGAGTFTIQRAGVWSLMMNMTLDGMDAADTIFVGLTTNGLTSGSPNLIVAQNDGGVLGTAVSVIESFSVGDTIAPYGWQNNASSRGVSNTATTEGHAMIAGEFLGEGNDSDGVPFADRNPYT